MRSLLFFHQFSLKFQKFFLFLHTDGRQTSIDAIPLIIRKTNLNPSVNLIDH